MKPIERVKNIIEYKKISISAFEKKTGMSNNSIQTAIKRTSNLKDDTLNSILNTFKDISAEWLLTGEGEMLKSVVEVRNVANEPVENYGLDFKEMYFNAKYTIEVQKKYIDKLEDELNLIKGSDNKSNAG